MSWTIMIPTLSLFLGVAILAHALLSGLLSILNRLTRSGRLKASMSQYAGKSEPEPLPSRRSAQAELLGLERIPWSTLYGLAALAGVAAYWQTRWYPALLTALLPVGIRSLLLNLRRRQLDRQAWYFLMDLRLSLGFKGSLLLVLQEIARDGRTPIAKALRSYVAGEQGGSLAILSRMAENTQLPFLGDLVARIQAAQSGTLKLDEAIRQAMGRLQAEMETRRREELQKAPSRLILLAFPGLLGPALFVLVFPLVARVIAAMQCFAWGGGF